MKIVVLDGYTENPGDLSWGELEKLGQVTVYDRSRLTDEDEAVSRIGDAEIVITNKTPITKGVMDACPAMKYIAMLATGYNVVDYVYAKEKGILLSNVPSYGTAAVASLQSPCCWKSATMWPTTAIPCTPENGRTARTGAIGTIR